MGWTSYWRDKHAETNAEHFAAKLDPRYKIIAHGTVAGVFYAAIHDETTSEVTAYIAITHWSRDPLCNFSYKDLSGVLTELTHVFVQVSWGSASFPSCPVKNVPEGI
jgi:hypothetical protein